MVPISGPEILRDIWFRKIEVLRLLWFKHELLRQGQRAPETFSVIEIAHKVSKNQDLLGSKSAPLLRGWVAGCDVCSWWLGARPSRQPRPLGWGSRWRIHSVNSLSSTPKNLFSSCYFWNETTNWWNKFYTLFQYWPFSCFAGTTHTVPKVPILGKIYQ